MSPKAWTNPIGQKASKHEDGADLISNLPDPILILIRSGLPSTEELIRTSILSRRWRYLWTSAPSLNFEYSGGRKRSDKIKFKEFVDRALLNRSVNLDSFRLCCWDYYNMSTIERWIHATVMRNVKQLDLSFSPSEDIVMPHCLVTCASLEVLTLSLGGRLILPRFSGFPALRVLQLSSVELFEDDLVNKFLESCPLDDCRLAKLNLICISCPKLKKLSISYWSNADLCGCLKLSCPKLVSLKIIGQVASNYIFEHLYSLKDAEINSHCNGICISRLFPTIYRLFHGISCVESLSTDLYFLYESIDATRDLVLPNLKTLELTTINAAYTVKGLNKILKICPQLESLSLTIENVKSYDSEDYDETEYPRFYEAETRSFWTPDAKWVEFFEFNGQKPKLAIDSFENNSEWMYMEARWGKEAR